VRAFSFSPKYRLTPAHSSSSKMSFPSEIMFRKDVALYIVFSSNTALLQIEMSFRSELMFKNAGEPGSQTPQNVSVALHLEKRQKCSSVPAMEQLAYPTPPAFQLFSKRDEGDACSVYKKFYAHLYMYHLHINTQSPDSHTHSHTREREIDTRKNMRTLSVCRQKGYKILYIPQHERTRIHIKHTYCNHTRVHNIHTTRTNTHTHAHTHLNTSALI